MENKAIRYEIDQNKSQTFYSPTIKMAIGNAAEIAIPKRRRHAHHVFVHLVAASAFTIILLVAPLYAQTGPSSVGKTPSAHPVFSGDFPQLGMQPSTLAVRPALESLPMPLVTEDEDCFPWAASAVRGFTVSVMTLQVPSKARKEFEKACGDMKKKKPSDAVQHARNAIENYPHYLAAWVMLGEALEGLQQTEEARNACESALSIERTYLPPYICLTEISVRRQEWDAVLNLTESVLRLSPAGDGYVYFSRATAYYRTERFAEAEKSALAAAGIATEHSSAPIYFLLAQIYEAEGHSEAAAAQVRHFLKLSTDRQESSVAKQYLATLEGQQATK